MGLFEAVRDKFEGEPFKVKFAAGFLSLLIVAVVVLLVGAAVADLGILGALLVMGCIGLVVLFFWSVITLASSGL